MNTISSIINNSPKVKTAHMSITRWMDKLNMVHHKMESYLAMKKEQSTDTCYSIDALGKHYEQ